MTSDLTPAAPAARTVPPRPGLALTLLSAVAFLAALDLFSTPTRSSTRRFWSRLDDGPISEVAKSDSLWDWLYLLLPAQRALLPRR